MSALSTGTPALSTLCLSAFKTDGGCVDGVVGLLDLLKRRVGAWTELWACLTFVLYFRYEL